MSPPPPVNRVSGSAPASGVQNIFAEHVEDIHIRYEDDLPDSIGFIAELERWKMFCAGLQKQDSNQSLEEAIELTDPNYYPNLHAVFRVLLTMPVGSMPCDRRSTCWTG